MRLGLLQLCPPSVDLYTAMPTTLPVGGFWAGRPTRNTFPESSQARVGSESMSQAGVGTSAESCHVRPPSVENEVANVKSYVSMFLNFFDAATICSGLLGLARTALSLRALFRSVSCVTWMLGMLRSLISSPLPRPALLLGVSLAASGSQGRPSQWQGLHGGAAKA